MSQSELDCHRVSWMVFCFSSSQTVGYMDTVFVTSFPATAERASYEVHRLLCIGELPTALISVVLTVVVLLAFVAVSERLGRAVHGHPLPSSRPPSLISGKKKGFFFYLYSKSFHVSDIRLSLQLSNNICQQVIPNQNQIPRN